MNRIRRLFFLRWFDRELSGEIRQHLEEKIEELIASGMLPEEARLEARRQFGNAPLIREKSQDVWGFRWLETLLQDLLYGLRQLRRNPGFTAVAVVTLALGIGANTAIFTVFDAVLLRALPVQQPGRLVMLTDTSAQGSSYGYESGTRDLLGYSEFEYLRDHNSVFAGIFAADSALPEVPVRLSSEMSRSRGKAIRHESVS